MTILTIETSGKACSVAIGAGSRVLASRFEEMTQGHSVVLVPMIGEVMAEAGVSFQELEGIAVTSGPGSFTGLRVGVATVKGLALAHDIPVVGIGAFEVIYEAWAAQNSKQVPCLVVIDSKRQDLYMQLFSASGKCLSKEGWTSFPSQVEDKVQSLLKVENKLPLAVIGDGAELVKADLEGEGRTFDATSSVIHATTLLPIAQRLFEEGRFGRTEDLQLKYLRPALVTPPPKKKVT